MTPDLVQSEAVAVADRMRGQIQAQNMAVGAFFGTEAELSKLYGVSRVVMREAALRLKTLGILESRKRKGLIVGRPDPLELWSQSLPSLAQSRDDRRELAMLRYTLEVGAIELAVTHATDEQIERLASIARRFEDVARCGGKDEEENELELAFHGLLLEMTGSRLMAGMQRVIHCFFESASATPHATRTADETIWQHHAIVSAIRERDLDRARTMIRLHFQCAWRAHESTRSKESGHELTR